MNKFVFIVFGALALFVFNISDAYSSSSICNSGYSEGICCSVYSSDFRWASGTGMCCGGISYYGVSVCPDSEVSCSGVSCSSGCGVGNVVRQNGWCSLGECSYYTFDCDVLDSCVDDDYVNYGCGGGSCLPTTTSCTGCDCVDDSGVQQTCGGFNIEENLLNKNCFDGKDNDCDGFCDSNGCDGKPRDPKCGLLIESIQDIKDMCPYDSITHTYTCEGWDNIIINVNLAIPPYQCYNIRNCRKSKLNYCIPNNIIFKASTNFSAKNFYVSNGGGTGGALTIEAKNIIADSLNTYGGMCKSRSCNCDGPFCSNSDGGPITLRADMIDVDTINANQGGGAPGHGGLIKIDSKIADIINIYSNGGRYNGCGDYGYDSGAGTGGSVILNAKNAVIQNIYLNGARRNYAYAGTGAGQAKLYVENLNIGNLFANGAMGSEGQGSGGNIKIYVDDYSLTSISASGPNGVISFFTDLVQPTIGLSANLINRFNRTDFGFFVFNTTIPANYKSYVIKIKDSLTNTYVKSIYGTDYEQHGFIDGVKISSFVGRNTPYLMKFGKNYVLVLSVSDDVQYNVKNCGVSAQCDVFEVPYSEY